MALTYPRPSPTGYGIASLTWRSVSVRSRRRSPFTLQGQAQHFSGQMWTGSLSVVPQYPEDGRALAAWLTSLRVAPGTFLLGDPAATAPLGEAADTPGTPVVAGAGQTGPELAISGAPPGTSGWLLAGDYCQTGADADARLHMLLEDVDTDTAGNATLTLFPGIRTAPANGSPLVVSSPQGVFVTRSNTSEWSVRAATIYDGIALDVEEWFS